MTRFRLLCVACVCAGMMISAGFAHATDIGFGFGGRPVPNAPASFADLAEKLLPMVVNISSSQKEASDAGVVDSPFDHFSEQFGETDQGGHDGDGFDGLTIPQASLGSGFVIDATKGLIITNYHVIKDSNDIRVTFHNDHTLSATVLGVDEKTDMAVLQVDAKKVKLSAAPFGNSDAMRVGDWIVAIGNPFGLGGTVTAGIISARARDINSGPYDDYLQTDASINRGNSGGPMFNTKGEVIGINTAIFSPSGGSVGIGFAVPSNLAKPVIDQIIKYGRTKRGWIGVRIQPVTQDIAESLGLPDARGALVASVSPQGPAEKGGLKPGDIVVKYNGQDIGGTRGLPRLVAESMIDTEATLAIKRDGRDMTIMVHVAELEQAEAKGLVTGKKTDGDHTDKQAGTVVLSSLGLTLGVITAQDRDDLELPDGTNGVIVLDVKAGSEGEAKGIEMGDIVVEVNQTKIDHPDKVKALVVEAENAGKATLLFLVDAKGQGDVRFVALKLKK